ncbi:hypothetical protein B0H10DRAFT_1969193 [Mycena sp. CBHHK59/15]|nr:hypothetical protein B0H10DRAFT_1969193 [Mycena sp. CBHHK59/15]
MEIKASSSRGHLEVLYMVTVRGELKLSSSHLHLAAALPGNTLFLVCLKEATTSSADSRSTFINLPWTTSCILLAELGPLMEVVDQEIPCQVAEASWWKLSAKIFPGTLVWCGPCVIKMHHAEPLHRIEKWSGTTWIPTTWCELGDRGGSPNCVPAVLFTLVDPRGIHKVSLDYCGCQGVETITQQLWAAGLVPMDQVPSLAIVHSDRHAPLRRKKATAPHRVDEGRSKTPPIIEMPVAVLATELESAPRRRRSEAWPISGDEGWQALLESIAADPGLLASQSEDYAGPQSAVEYRGDDWGHRFGRSVCAWAELNPPGGSVVQMGTGPRVELLDEADDPLLRLKCIVDSYASRTRFHEARKARMTRNRT